MSERRTDAPSTFTEILSDRARSLGDTRAFTFLPDGRDGDDADALDLPGLSYAGLERRALAVAGRLRAVGATGGRAILVFPPGLDFVAAFFGCLYAGVVAVPAHPPRANRGSARLGGIVDDAGPAVVLTPEASLSDVDRWAVPGLSGVTRLGVGPADEGGDAGCAVKAEADALAFLQYTSGSTSGPKGVMISHGNLVANSAQIAECFGSTADSRGVFWLPLFHDMGLIGGVLQTVYCGGSSTLMSPASFLQRPARWLRAVSATGATISGGPDFAFDLCARKVTAEQKAGLDLSRWAVAFNGAEPVRAETLDRFAEAFAPCGFRREAFLPCYGLAEATLLVSGRRRRRPTVLFVNADALATGRVEVEDVGQKQVVGSGGLPSGQEVTIVDPVTGEACAPDRVGEIRVRGGGVARGYWNRDDATEPTFTRHDDGTRTLRTGDLGFLRDGEVFVTGRLKDVIIVGGRNVYPQDLEWAAEASHPALRAGGAAAFSVERGGRERVVIAVEVERAGKTLAAADAIAAVRGAVAEAHDLDVQAVCLLKPLSLPRTSSGKVQRHACRETFLAGTLETVARWDRAESAEPEPVAAAGRSEFGPRGESDITQWLAAHVAGPLGVAASDVDHRVPLSLYGLGSVQAVSLAGDLEAWLGRPVPPTLAYEFPTIEALARHLSGSEERSSQSASGNATAEPIAVIGIGCRFPGAEGPERFWRMLADGVDAVGPMPESRRVGDETDARPGGYLDRVDTFDAAFFGVSPREAAATDPQQRVLLEVAWEAIEDAGLVAAKLAGTPVGVFVGIATDDYSRLGRGEGGSDGYALTGNAASIAANRVSYALDLRGPSLAVDTACSSSLVAVHLACQSLRTGESTVALAGGVNLLLAPEVSADFARAGFLSPEGRCKAFGAGADGYVRGEGAGVVVLKPLSRAKADGDAVYAVIRGSAVNQDGRSNGLTAPSRRAQEGVIRAALTAAGVPPARVDYVEAHGTGTRLGDPIEAAALAAVLGEGRDAGSPCAIGSVKTNVGHLEAAAGIAGFIKVALMLRRRATPPTLHSDEPSPQIPFEALPLRLARGLTPFEGDAPVVAGVSAFGFGGTNAHVILESAPGRVEPSALADRDVLIPISARDPAALRDLAGSYRDLIASGVGVHDLAPAAARHRDAHDHRVSVAAGSSAEAADALDAYARGESRPDLASGRRPPGRRPGLVFVFSGQGGLWPGAGRELLEREPVVRAFYDECDRWLVPNAGRSLVAELLGGPVAAADPEFAQTHQFALQGGLVALLKSWGVSPDAVVGHSLGEVAAAHAVGALSLDDALRVVRERGRLMRRVSGKGKAAAVALPVEVVRGSIVAWADRLFIAAVNGPNLTTVSGDPDAVDAFVAARLDEHVFARVLDVECAFHSPHMDPIRGDLEAALVGVSPRPSATPYASTVTGRWVDPRELGAAYWGRNLRETVLLTAAVETLAAGPYETYLEIGPHPIHVRPIAETLDGLGRRATTLGTLRRGEPERRSLLRTLGTLFTQGRDVDWPAVQTPGRSVSLPTYPWRRERFWLEPVEPAAVARNGLALSNGHPEGNGRAVYPYANGNGHTPHNNHATDAPDLFYETVWSVAEPIGGAVPPVGPLVVIADRGGYGSRLAARLDALGHAHTLTQAESLSDVLDAPASGVIDLRGLDLAGAVERDIAKATAEAARVGIGVTAAANLLSERGGPRHWVVTRGAQPVGNAPDPVQATLWGLGRSLAQARRGVWGGLIDLDPDGEASADEFDALLAEVAGNRGEDQVALRGTGRHVPRLVRTPKAAVGEGPTVRPEGTYLITGGLGDLGLKVAAWLAGRGARRLVLVGRQGLPDRSGWDALPAEHPARARVDAVLGLERGGVTVVAAAVDVSDRGSVAGLFDRLARDYPPVRGVIHAAGVVALDPPGGPDGASYEAVLGPKLAGGWLLHEFTAGLPLDFFVLFSSVSSVWGAPKVLAYAAANQALDALAHRRASAGLPALSVAWGPWAGGGMAAASGSTRSLELAGLTPLSADAGLEALGRLMAGAPASPQTTVSAVDWSRFAPLHGGGRPAPFLSGLVAVARPKGPGRASANGRPTTGREALVRFFREQVAAVLRLDPEKVDPDLPLNALGLDSLTAMELRAAVEAGLDTALPMTTLLDGPSVSRLADEVLARTHHAGAHPGPTPTSEPADGLAPTASQQSLWYAHQLAPDGGDYNIAGAARVRSRLDRSAFGRAVDFLVARHEALRTTFPAVDGRPVLRVVDAPGFGLTVEDASGWTDADLDRRSAREAARPFDLERGPLCRVFLWSKADDDHVVLIVTHHIIGDFWSTAVLVDEFSRAYAAEAAGVRPALDPLPLRFSDFARWQAGMLAGPGGERLWSYWRGQLAGPLPELNLPADRPRPAARSHRGGVRGLDLDPALTKGLAAMAGAHGVSLYTCLLAGFQALLGRLGGHDDVVIGSAVAGRSRQGLEGLLGYFMNLVPVRADLSGNPTFEALLGRLRPVVHGGLEHQDFPYPLMVQRLGLGLDPSRTPLFQVLFIYQKAQRLDDRGLTPFALSTRGHTMTLGGLGFESLDLHNGGAPFDLTLVAAAAGDRLSLKLEYAADLFDPATADRLLAQFRTLLAAAAADPGRPLGELPLMSAEERERVLTHWGAAPARSDAPPALVHDLFADRAGATPDAEAVVFGDTRLTYRELNERANRLAHRLRGLGVNRDAVVGLHAGRTPAVVVGLLGILKAGGAYLPLDPGLPAARLGAMAGDAGAGVVVTDGLQAAAEFGASVVVDLSADAAAIDAQPSSNPPPSARGDDVAYVIYTSGSTGAPKGVMVSHASLAGAFSAWEAAYGLRNWRARHLQMAGIGFDVFTGDWTRALCSGGTLVSCPRETLLDPEALEGLVRRERVDCAEFVPAVVEGLLDRLDATGETLPAVRLVAVGSDLVTAGLYQRLTRFFPSARVVNSYGLTETTVDSTYFEGDLSAAPPDAPAPIGRPFPGTEVRVLDRWLEPSPVGVTGELFVGGAGVARGYLGRPGLTAERFLPDPFSGRPGARLYRTGDLARWRPDGSIELIGRADRQVKVRGHRVELGEVEAALRRHAGVRDAAVVVREGPGGDRRLAAFVIARGDSPTNPQAELRAWLARSLPDAMVPSTVVVLDAFPLSPNGKVDRLALASITPTAGPEDARREPPRTAAETILTDVAAGVLGVDSVGVRDNLFDLGIDSIGVVRIVARARAAGLKIDPASLFQNATVADLALAATPLEQPPAAPVKDDLLVGVDRTAVLREFPDVEDVYPPTPVQEGMLFHTRHEPDAGVYVEQFTCRLVGPLDVDALVAAWGLAVSRHPALRSAFHWVESDRLVQAVHRRAELPVERLDWSGLDAAGLDARLSAYLREDRRRGFVPSLAPLSRLAVARVSADDHRLVWTAHHLVFDGWSLPVVLGEVLAVYEAAAEGLDPALPAPRPFRDYVAWLGLQDLGPAEAYWRKALAGFRTPTPLGVHRDAPADLGGDPPFAEVEQTVSPADADALAKWARARRLTLAAVVHGAWSLVLSRYSGRRDVTHGVTASGRPTGLDGAEGIVGPMINTLPLRVEVDEDAFIEPWLRAVQARLVGALKYESVPPLKLLEWGETPRGRGLFDSVVIVQNVPVGAGLAAGSGRLGVRDARVYEQTSYPLTVSVTPGEGLSLRLGFDARRLDPEAVARLAAHFRNVIAGVAADPHRRLSGLAMLSEAEHAELTSAWTDGHAEDPLDALSEDELDAYLAAIRDSTETDS